MSFWKTVGTVSLGILEEIGNAAEEARKLEAQEKLELERMQKEAEILSKELIKQQELNTVTFVYNINDLQAMKTEELRKEVYSIYQENNSIWSTPADNYKIGQEAWNLYTDRSRSYSETRYRAKLIKFLYENGNL